VYKSLGAPSLSRAYLSRAMLDENVQYLILALFWLTQVSSSGIFFAKDGKPNLMRQCAPRSGPSTVRGSTFLEGGNFSGADLGSNAHSYSYPICDLLFVPHACVRLSEGEGCAALKLTVVILPVNFVRTLLPRPPAGKTTDKKTDQAASQTGQENHLVQINRAIQVGYTICQFFLRVLNSEVRLYSRG
jgi:hypothetical protein